MHRLRILLVCNLLVEGSTSLLVAQALSNLGHSVIFHNFLVKRDLPTAEYDMAIVWTGRPVDISIFKGKPVAYIYLDDNDFWKQENQNNTIENCTKGYTHIFTNMLWEGYDYSKYKWVPLGCLREVHNRLQLSEEERKFFESDVVFIGTDRGKRREFIKELSRKLDKKYKIRVWGNGWVGLSNTKPVYFYDFARVMSASKIVVTEHWKNALSTNDCEKPSFGTALTITDSKLVKTEYPNMPYYSNVDEAVQHCHYYLEHEEERQKLVIELAEIAHKKFTYEIQLAKIINSTMGESIHPDQ